MRRRYTRSYRRSGYVRRRKWSPVFFSQISNLSSDTTFGTVTLAQNSVNQGGTAPIATIVKVKNFKVVVDVVSVTTSNGSPSSTFAIMYLPQGYTADINLMTAHPEWIMAWRSIDLQTTNTVQVSSRLTRNLNSGDSIIFFITRNFTGAAPVFGLSLQVSFVTCNN